LATICAISPLTAAKSTIDFIIRFTVKIAFGIIIAITYLQQYFGSF